MSATPAAELIESLTRQLLRLEAGTDKSAPAAAAEVAANVVSVVPASATTLAALAAVIAAVTSAVRDGRAVNSPETCSALLEAADALAIGLGLAGDPTGSEAADAACARLEAVLATAPPAAVAAIRSDWPAPGGAVPAELLAQFSAEAGDSLHEAEVSLLELDSAHSAEAVNRLFRALHSIKGVAGYVGLAQLRVLSHRLESVLEAVRRGRLDLDTGVTDFLFRGVDHLKGMVAALTPEGESPRDLAEFVAALDILATHTDSSLKTERDGRVLEAAFREAARQHLDGLTDALRSLAAGDFTDTTFRRLSRAATGLTTAAEVTGRADVAVPANEFLGVIAQLTKARTRLAGPLAGAIESPAPSIQEQPRPSVDASPLPRPRVATPTVIEPTATAVPATQTPDAVSNRGNVTTKTMRVDQRKLDEYLNLTGELVIARNALVHAFRSPEQASTGKAAYKEVVEKVCRIISDVQNNAMSMRMVPVGTVFQRVPRLVRDVAKQLGKVIELVTAGEETELDKQVAEALSDPLVHLIRNAADHGIEMPDARGAAGKPAAGVISLRAGREGNTIILDIEDDGGGIDVSRLKAKAVAAGIVTEAQAATMPTDAANELIFAPGLSTAKVVSDLSGRGVGMDVVRSNIVALGGSVAVRSELGRGTVIRLTLPLTLAVSTVVLVEVSGTVYGLPIDSVRETLKVEGSGYKQLGGGRAITLRGEVIPVIRLAKLITPSSVNPETQDDDDRVVVMAVGATRFGLQVDSLKGQQEVVIKPVPPPLGHLDGIGGTTIAGDGGVVLILDPAGLLRLASTHAATTTVQDLSRHPVEPAALGA